MIHLTVAEAQQRLPKLLAAASSGEIVEITHSGFIFHLTAIQPRLPRLRPAATGVPHAGRLKGQLIVPDDFDQPLQELHEYME